MTGKNPFEPSASPMGFFSAEVFTANRAIPLSGATVQVFAMDEETPKYTLTTDRAGKTETVSLPTKPPADSQDPGNTQPFEEYRVLVDADGFYQLKVGHLPVFANVLSVLPANMVPISAYNSGEFAPSTETDTARENPQALFKEVKA